MQMSGTNGTNGVGALTSTPLATAITTAATHIGDGSRINPFTKAVKYNAKGRIALIGPAGGGKSFTALVLARALAGPNGKIAAIDTEHGSLSKYADLFDFDVVELDSFSPQSFTDALHAAEDAGYAVFLCDSLSHFWTGKDGAFDIVDMAQARQKDQQAGWKAFRPQERTMVDDMIASSCHIICTLRTKNDYQEQTNAQGQKKRVKIGLAPVQREGLEYEFDLVGYMDEENTLSVDKTRCPTYSQKAFNKPDSKTFVPFVEWLKGASREPKPRIIMTAIDTGGHPAGTTAAAQHVAQNKIEELKTSGEIKRAFAAIREPLGEFTYLGILAKYGVKSPEKFTSTEEARKCYREMLAAAKKGVA
jgi:hypothetical protein